MPTEESVFSKELVFNRLEDSFSNARKALASNNIELANFLLRKLLNQVISLSNTTLLTPEESILFLRTIHIRIKNEKLKFLPDLIQEIRVTAKLSSIMEQPFHVE